MVRWTLDLIRFLRFSRTITSVPFALGAYVAVTEAGGDPETFLTIFFVILLGAVIFLLFNRGYTFSTDSHVPRDRERERLFDFLGHRLTVLLTAVFVFLFILMAYQLNSTAFYLSPLALSAVFLYVPSRHCTVFNHACLGLVASLLVVGPYVGINGWLGMEGLAGGAAVFFWITGFDIIYSLRHVEKDRSQGEVSLPMKKGPTFALYTGGVTQVMGLFCFFAYAVHAGLGDVYLGFMSLFSLILFYTYMTIRRLGHLQLVRRMFRLNAILSIGFFTTLVLEHLIRV